MEISQYLRLNLSKFVFALLVSISTYCSLSIYDRMHSIADGVDFLLLSLIAGIIGFFMAFILPD